MLDIKIYLDDKRNHIDRTLIHMMDDSKSKSRIQSAMMYSLMAGGKRLRPILCLASVESVGGRFQDALAMACAIEMIHTYSLIHDDLPAMDNDAVRRGKPTCHIQFDEATAILAGDGLLTLAFEILSSPVYTCGVDPVKQIEIIHMISRAAGYAGMVGGQMQDIAAEGCALSMDELESMHRMKTGALIEASVCCGAISGDATPIQLRQLQIFGRCIGLAFQVKDDMLNIEGDSRTMGKSTGTDQFRGKTTYPSIMGLERARQYADELRTTALQALDNFDNKSDPLRAIAAYITRRAH